MGGECGTYGREFLCGNLKEREHLIKVGIDGRIILKRLSKK
jgi:hypothetical protein